jgi:tetratricopeptide (TPR) repeat protein
VPYRNLALARFASKDNDAALATLKDGIGRAKNPEALQADLARVFEQLGRVDEAVAVYDAALARNPQSDLAANNLAMLLVTYRKDKPSLDRARALVAHFANSTDLNFLDTYGWVMYKYGDAAVAVGALRDVLAKAPKSPLSMYHLGMAQALAGQNDAARDNLAHSLQAGQKFAGMDEAQATLDRLGAPAPAVAAAPKS